MHALRHGCSRRLGQKTTTGLMMPRGVFINFCEQAAWRPALQSTQCGVEKIVAGLSFGRAIQLPGVRLAQADGASYRLETGFSVVIPSVNGNGSGDSPSPHNCPGEKYVAGRIAPARQDPHPHVEIQASGPKVPGLAAVNACEQEETGFALLRYIGSNTAQNGLFSSWQPGGARFAVLFPLGVFHGCY
ncbi:hypothetical protein [Pollutimonas bauzanensis]|nr:hypothetical protein [Pollutimonas bauzanensis]